MRKKRLAWDCENVLRYCLARPYFFWQQGVAHTNPFYITCFTYKETPAVLVYILYTKPNV